MSKQSNSDGRRNQRRQVALINLEKALKKVRREPGFTKGLMKWVNKEKRLTQTIQRTKQNMGVIV